MGLDAVVKIIVTIADVEDTNPEDLDISLQNCIDADAIRQLVEHDGNSWELQFDVRNHDVTVTGDGAVCVNGVQSETIAD